jgi:putative ABC transport system permease protein
VIRLSGRVRSALVIGGQGIRARKLRTLLSMLSLFLGVLAVVVVQAGAETARRAALADVELISGKDGTRQIFLPPDARSLPQVLDVVAHRPDVVASTNLQAIIGEPGVAPVNPGGSPAEDPGAGSLAGSFKRPAFEVICRGPGECEAVPVEQTALAPPGQAVELRLTTITGDIRQFRPFRSESGQWLDFASAPSLAPRLVVNKAAARLLARHRVPAEMRIDGATANTTPRIVGVVDDGLQEPAAYVRLDEMLNWLPHDKVTGGGLLVLAAPSVTDVEPILQARLAALGMPGDVHGERINSRESAESHLALLRWLFLGMAALVLLIGVAGILNVGLATVGERVEEFALRRAVGTPRSLLAAIVLTETLLTGLLTAAAAIGVAALALKFGGRALSGRLPFPTSMAFPWQAGVAGVVAGLAAGLLGGLVPAVRAARIKIATVMRA